MAKKIETNGDQVLADNMVNPNFENPELAKLFAGMEDVSLGFPPYLLMGVGVAFRGIPMLYDTRGEFPRYHVQLCMPRLDCRTGSVKDGEIITVERGQIFSMAAYAALPLDNLFGFEIGVVCVSEDTLQRNQEDIDKDRVRSLFRFKTMLKPEDKKGLQSDREDDMKFLKDQHKRMRQLAMENMIRNLSTPKARSTASAPA